MFGRTWRVGRIAGIEIAVDRSWAVVAALITYGLYVRFTTLYPQLDGAEGLAIGIAASALFFGSVLLHELAHAVTARRRGIVVRGITLFMFGGATHARLESGTATDEFVVTALGPASSLALAGVFGGIALTAGDALPPAIAGVFGYLGWVNLVLAVFNLLPGFPLDGGRILRSLVWRATGDLDRATTVAGRAGEVVGYGIVAVGLVLALGGGVITGLWLSAIGWFLAQAARGSRAEVLLRRVLREADAQDVMSRDLSSVPSDITVRRAVDEFLVPRGRDECPVAEGGRIVGIVTAPNLRHIPRGDWGRRAVRDVMVRLEDEPAVAPEASMETVLAELEDHDPVVVVQDGEVVGLITFPAVSRWLQHHRGLRGDEWRRSA